MGFKQKMSSITGINENLVPASYQIVGNVMLLKLEKMKEGQKTKLAQAAIKKISFIQTTT